MNAEEILKDMTRKKFVKLVNRCNSAIKLALGVAKEKGFDRVYIPDEGGWLTYKKFAEKKGFNVTLLKTDNGLIDADSLRGKKGVLLYQSLAGYFAEQNVKKIGEIFEGFIILDVCNLGEYEFDADILIGSFGKWKVVELGYGGFIAADFDIDVNGYSFDSSKEEELIEKLSLARKRLKYLYHKSKKVKNDLKCFDVIHKDKKGINVIVRFNNEEEKEKIMDYCDAKGYEYTMCPRYIRVNDDAISIELKRIS